MKWWEILLAVAGLVLNLVAIMVGLLQLATQEWAWRWVFELTARRRRKKQNQLEARKVFLTTLHDSAAEQARYLLQGLLIVLAAVAAVIVLGMQMGATWPRVVPGFAWACAWGVYFFALYRLGVDRRVRKPELFKKVIGQIDAQLAALQAAEHRDKPR